MVVDRSRIPIERWRCRQILEKMCQVEDTTLLQLASSNRHFGKGMRAQLKRMLIQSGYSWYQINQALDIMDKKQMEKGDEK